MAPAPEAKRARVGGDEAGVGAGGVGEEPLLYSYWRSSCSYRVRIVLALKGIPYAYHAVHLLKEGGQQLTPAYAALNPSKVVPTLVVDGHVLAQSGAIVEYLEETRPTPALLPADAAGRAVVRQLCAIIACDTQPVQNLRVLKHVAGFFPDAKEKEARRTEWAVTYIAAGLAALEGVMAKTAGTYCHGDTLTLADAFLVPQVYNAVRFKVDMAPYPTVARVNATLLELPAFKAAHPAAQPDAEKE